MGLSEHSLLLHAVSAKFLPLANFVLKGGCMLTQVYWKKQLEEEERCGLGSISNNIAL